MAIDDDEDRIDREKAELALAATPQYHLDEAVRKFTSTNARRDGHRETRLAEAHIHLGIANVMLLQQISRQLDGNTDLERF